MKKTIKGVIKPSELAPFIENRNGLNSFLIVFLYASAFGLIYLGYKADHWMVTLLCMLVMGAVQHTLATFIHEAAHGHVFSNKKWNDRLGQLFYCAPFMNYLDDYRYFHWEHHRHTGKIDKDPELAMYAELGIKTGNLSQKEIARVLFNDIVGINYVKSLSYLLRYFKAKREEGLIEKPTLYQHFTIALWYIGIPVLMWKLGLLSAFLLIWVIPMMTVSPTLLRWHGFGEHIREKDSCLCENTLTHRFNIVSTLFLYPINSSFHLEHHLYPQLPWHALKKFRNWADQNPKYKELASELEVDSFFFGQKSVIQKTFKNQTT